MAQMINLAGTDGKTEVLRISPMTRTHDGNTVVEFVSDSGSTLLVLDDLEALKLIAVLSNAAHAHMYNRAGG